MKTTSHVLEVRDNPDLNAEDCPLPLSVIPNHMGINLSEVQSIVWVKREDGQITKLTINFAPAEVEPKYTIPDHGFICGRRRDDGAGPGSPFWKNQLDYWCPGGTCSYCGSFSEDEFMAELESGELTLSPTDKGYKAYANSSKRSYQKFYFQHLTEAQQGRFIELLNEGKVKFGEPGHFYVLPFFVGIKGYDFEARKGPKPTVYCRRGEEAL